MEKISLTRSNYLSPKLINIFVQFHPNIFMLNTILLFYSHEKPQANAIKYFTICFHLIDEKFTKAKHAKL